MSKFGSTTSRRAALMGMGAAALILPSSSVWAQARSTVSSATRGASSTCSNSGVATSDTSRRLSTVADFASVDTCQMTPETVEGPYFICDGFESTRNISGGKEGQAMALAVRVQDQSCTPIPGAFVDVWHCDAMGFYSGHDINPDNIETVRNELGKTRVPDLPERFLRGVLATDVDGIAEFDMTYPSFYDARAIHTHYKVHIGDKAFLTAQGLYPEEINAQVMATAPYNTPRAITRLANADDLPMIDQPGMFKVVERGGQLLSLITLTVQT